MTRPTSRWLAGAALVAAGWLASPGSVPVYDGLGTDEPYRTVGGNPAPTSATVSAPVDNGRAGALQLRTGETGPQLLIDLAAGTFTSTAPTVTLTGNPFTPDGTPPRGTFDGNGYRITVSPGATLQTDGTPYLFLRANVMTKPAPVIVHRTAATDPWTEVPTSTTGRDILATSFKALGDYAVVRLPSSKPVNASGVGTTRILFLGAGVLLLVVITVLVLRRRPVDED